MHLPPCTPSSVSVCLSPCHLSVCLSTCHLSIFPRLLFRVIPGTSTCLTKADRHGCEAGGALWGAAVPRFVTNGVCQASPAPPCLLSPWCAPWGPGTALVTARVVLGSEGSASVSLSVEWSKPGCSGTAQAEWRVVALLSHFDEHSPLSPQIRRELTGALSSRSAVGVTSVPLTPRLTFSVRRPPLLQAPEVPHRDDDPPRARPRAPHLCYLTSPSQSPWALRSSVTLQARGLTPRQLTSPASGAAGQ